MKRSALFVLITVQLVLLFCGCKPFDDRAAASSFETGDSSLTFSDDDIDFLDTDGSSKYVIVRPEEESYTEMASALYKNMKSVLGVNVKNTLDSANDGTDLYEILIGKTSRSESAMAYNRLLEVGTARSDDFIICTIGKKIVINAVSNGALSEALTYFSGHFVSKDGVKGGIYYVNKTDVPNVNYTVNGVQLGRFSIVRPHYNSSYLTEVEMEKISDTALNVGKYNLPIVEDMYTDESEFEIVVGNTNRAGVEDITDHDEYRITVKGHKVYLNGGSPHATAIAVTEFSKLLFGKDVTDADSVVGSYSKTIAGYDDTQYYVHKWGDDFDGTEVDKTKWDVIDNELNVSHLGDGTESWRIEECTFVENGKLYQMQLFDEEAGIYYGGTIRTNKHMKYMGGYLEQSVITPDLPISWNTLWLRPVEPSIIGPEVDLNENFGNASVTNFNAHVWPDPSNKYGWEHRSFDTIKPNEKRYMLPDKDRATHNLNTEFHTYGFLWTEDYIAFTGDGRIYVDFDLNQEGYEDYKMAYTVNAACSMIIAASPGTTGDASLVTDEHWERSKSDYVTEYVHIYQLNDGWSHVTCDY